MRYGNTTAASVIIALTEAWEEGKIHDGDLVVLAALVADLLGVALSFGGNI